MGMTSAAEAKLDARIRPDIAMMRSRTSYPKRRMMTVTPNREPATTAPRQAARTSDTPVAPVTETAVLGSAVLGTAVPTRRAVPEGPIRLTRRGRIVVGVLVVISALAAAAVVWLVVASQAQASGHVPTGQTAAGHALKRVVVRPGQTLWSIAMSADPTADPRVIVQQIIDENELSGPSIQVGQVLWVPRI
jgi:LysM repeat protein